MTKPARRIEDLTAQVARGKSMLTLATANLAAWPAKAAAMVEAALATARADHEAASEVDRQRIRDLGVEYRVLERDRNEKAARIAGLQHQITRLIEERRQDAETIAALESRIATMADVDADFDRRAAALDRASRELHALVGAVRERMRRREQEEADAALNRAAIASAVPGFRRP